MGPSCIFVSPNSKIHLSNQIFIWIASDSICQTQPTKLLQIQSYIGCGGGVDGDVNAGCHGGVEVDENHEVDKLVEVEEEVDKELKLNNNVGKKVGGSSDTRK